MSLTLKILPALALAIALSPLAAQARRINTVQQIVSIFSPITPGSAQNART